jgi:ribosomal protein S18 acetylase RimI-like enzyme
MPPTSRRAAEELRMTGPSFAAAGTLDLSALTALWNRAYAGYFVPVLFDEAQMARHLRRSGVDLSLSLVALQDGRACGLSLAARRDERAYIAGFGIAGESRRQGLARRLIAAQVERLAAAGVREAQLEVIAVNPARAVYRGAGFVDGRTLRLLEGRLAVAPQTGEMLDGAALAPAWEALHGAARPTWRRELPTLLDAMRHDGAVAIGVRDERRAIAACAVMIESAGQVVALLDAAAADEAAGRRLAAALVAQAPQRHWRLGDEPAGSAVDRALQACGLQPGLEQVEMRRPIG